MFTGKRTSVIFYDTEQFRWVWYDRKNNKSLAVSYASEDSLLIGVHDIDFSGVVDDKCYKGGSRVKRIKLTSCGEREFTCTDGQCIDMEQRCDQTSNCRDESDEENCGILFMKENYNKKISPFQFDKIKQENIPVNINISMAVIDILRIKEVDHVYTLKYRLTMVWYDYRLKYYNLKHSRSQNALALHEVEKLWIPFLVFDNTEDNEATKGTSDTEITLAREGEYVRSGDHVVEEINIFDGAKNRITFEQVYTKTFKCVYKLHIYPFDRQVTFTVLSSSGIYFLLQICFVNLVVRDLESSVVQVTPDRLSMESETVLTQYIIKNWTLAYNNNSKILIYINNKY